MVIYVVMHHGAWLYVYFFALKASVYTVFRTPALTLHHVVTRMIAWLYIKLMVMHIYLYSNIPLYHMRLYTWHHGVRLYP